MKQSFFAAIAALIISLAPALAETPAAIFDDYWKTALEEDPFSATGAGISDFNDRVPAVAPADHERRLEQSKAFLARLDALNPVAISVDDKLNADLLRFILRHDIALAEFKTWRIPFLSDSGFHNAMGYVVASTTFRTESDYRAYLKRLSALPGYIDQNIANMRLGLADGFAQPKEIMAGILPSFDAQAAAKPAEHSLYEPFTRIPGSVPKKTAATLRAEGLALIETKVIPAYRRAAEFMRAEYAPAALDKVGAAALPDGAAYYQALVKYFTTRDDATADQIHMLGLKEVGRIRKEMDAVIKTTGFQGDFKAFQQFLRSDPQFYAKTPEELLMRAAWLSKSIDGKLPAYFGKLPRQPYSVQPVPAEIAPNYTTGRYSGAPAGASRGGEYWVNTYALDKRPFYELPALTLHEAVPGHHLQAALALEVENAPMFRTQFYPHAFGEGWGLYSEKLGVEMGVYKTPYDEFGRLSYEMWRACRLVIDTGLHAKGWTRQQALDYLAGNTALSLKNVETEVDRYIAWPGQALAYKVGELTIWELRRKAEKALGPKFDIREFHDAVLVKGGLPLEILSAEIDAYIAREKAK
ncbi:MAG: DUF885 family protein [Parvularculaceae bacterium]|nr:DUF885 family protein [Parvularculaceae bacterium]